jgi:hypothetical protein
VNLTYWLRKTPQPTAILADDKRIEVPRNGRAWRDLTATIKALEPSKLTCLDGAGAVIRSVVLESDDDKAPPSAEMSDLQLFAKLLAEGYEHGRNASQPLVDSAMQFVERQGVRLAKAEGEIERLRGHIHKLNLQIAELSGAAGPAADESLVGAMLAGALQSNNAVAALQQTTQPQPSKRTNGAQSQIKGAKK